MALHSNVFACEIALRVCLDLPLVWSVMSDIMRLRHVRWEVKKSNELKRDFFILFQRGFNLLQFLQFSYTYIA